MNIINTMHATLEANQLRSMLDRSSDPFRFVIALELVLLLGKDWTMVVRDFHLAIASMDTWTAYNVWDDMKGVLKQYSDKETEELRNAPIYVSNPSGWDSDEFLFHLTHGEQEEYIPF